MPSRRSFLKQLFAAPLAIGAASQATATPKLPYEPPAVTEIEILPAPSGAKSIYFLKSDGTLARIKYWDD